MEISAQGLQEGWDSRLYLGPHCYFNSSGADEYAGEGKAYINKGTVATKAFSVSHTNIPSLNLLYHKTRE